MFSQASEYALRALTELARRKPGEWVLTHELADSLEIPVHYLAKVLQTLARRSILDSQRGRQGGFRLARPPQKISAFEVVEQLDDIRSLESCIMGEDVCSDADPCPLHALWSGLKRRFIAELRRTSLRELADFNPRTRARSVNWPCSRCQRPHPARKKTRAKLSP